ncbi:hypothetical protein J2Z79_002205 [Symbiobacterium terraclitae]|uniref:Uncharacterized protein n=1 Tax=Symbiobacterium terraclitae TaxID=557451 RepID=A0ABS4JTD0_9FIRM|nr:hypothetical protein [Symbiobacterium terraclitae]MBP2018790.1 hypothetical protein [Symbiobacterium terraclitae]
MKELPERPPAPGETPPQGLGEASSARPATDEEVEAAVEAFFARYRRALERLGTC